MSRAPDRPDEPATTTVDSRQPYAAPTIESEDLFEVLALACGKINPTTIACIQIPKTS